MKLLSYFAVKLISVDRSGKFTFKYHILNHFNNRFLCLIVRNVTKRDTFGALQKCQNGIIYTFEERQKCIFLRLKTDTLLALIKSESRYTFDLFSGNVLFLTIKHREQT